MKLLPSDTSNGCTSLVIMTYGLSTIEREFSSLANMMDEFRKDLNYVFAFRMGYRL